VVVVPEAQTFAFSPHSFLFRLQGERIWLFLFISQKSKRLRPTIQKKKREDS
jgi:hypothetical protein